MFSKTVFYEVILTSQPSHLEALLLCKFWTERVILIFVDNDTLLPFLGALSLKISYND